MSHKLKKLTDKHIYAAYLLTLGTSIDEVALKVGVSKTTIYNWKQDELFKTALTKEYEIRKTEAKGMFIQRVAKIQKEIYDMMFDKESIPANTRARLMIDWLNRAGLSFSEPIISDEGNKEKTKLEEERVQKEFEELLEENPEIEEIMQKALEKKTKKDEK